MESEGYMTTTDARGWINALIKAMHEETSGTWPDPKYKDEVYSALEMAIKALENHDTFMKYAYSQGKQDALSQEPCTDAVSRDEAINTAIDAVDDWDGGTNLHRTEIITNAMKQLPSVNPQPCDDAISRKAVFNAIEREDKWLLAAKGHNGLTEIAFSGLKARIDALPSVTQKSGKCKNCKYFEYDSVAKVDGVPLIVAHEICSRWGEGCKTREDGYCFLYEPQERSEKE